MFLYYNACVFLLNGKLGKSIDIFAKLCFRLWLTNVYTTVIYIYTDYQQGAEFVGEGAEPVPNASNSDS